jgi:hypothetical protein
MRNGAGHTFVSECYWPGVGMDLLADLAARARRVSKEMTAAGVPVRYVRSWLFLDEESVFCLFEAGSREVAVAASERALIPFDRVVEAVEL